MAPLPGDIHQDGAVDLLDVAPIVALLISGGNQVEADVNADDVVNLLEWPCSLHYCAVGSLFGSDLQEQNAFITD